jgi:hypothetical protein
LDSPVQFIITKNSEAAEKMQSYGLQLACSGSNFWEFVFDGKFKFDKLPDTKLTNKLLF